jgi:hypothetical protein
MSRSSRKGLARATPAHRAGAGDDACQRCLSRYLVRVGPGSVEVGDDFAAATFMPVVELVLWVALVGPAFLLERQWPWSPGGLFLALRRF